MTNNYNKILSFQYHLTYEVRTPNIQVISIHKLLFILSSMQGTKELRFLHAKLNIREALKNNPIITLSKL